MKLRKPSQVAEMTAEQIHTALVEDFVQGTHTPLPAFIAGIRALAERRRESEEKAFQDVRQEALALGGRLNQFDVPQFR